MSWLAGMAAAVVLVAITVAWWEHRKRLARGRRERHRTGDSHPQSEPRDAQVDVNLDATHEDAESPPQAMDAARDPSARRAVLERALSRMAADPETPTPAAETDAWADTEPLVALGRSERSGAAFAETLPADLPLPMPRGG